MTEPFPIGGQPSQGPLPPMTWREKVSFTAFILLFPALTVMVLFRHRLGFNIVKPWRLWLMAALLVFGPALFSDVRGTVLSAPSLPVSGSNTPLTLFALVMLAAGLGQRWRRWQEFQHGKPWHSRYPGDSYIVALLNRLPFPLWHHWVRRFIEPAIVVTVGLIILPSARLHALGLWLIFAAFALYLYEYVMFIRSVEVTFEQQDGLSMGQMRTIIFGRTGERAAAPKPPTVLPTGPASDTERLRALREGRAAGVAGSAPASIHTKDPPATFAAAPPLLLAALLAMVLLALAFSYAMTNRTGTTAGGLFPTSTPPPDSAPALVSPQGGLLNVAGIWREPTSEENGITLNVEYRLSQSGTTITGTSQKTVSGPLNSIAVFAIAGTAAPGSVTLHETKLERQSGRSNWCRLQTMTLTPNASGQLTGRSIAPPCPPMQVTLTRNR